MSGLNIIYVVWVGNSSFTRIFVVWVGNSHFTRSLSCWWVFRLLFTVGMSGVRCCSDVCVSRCVIECFVFYSCCGLCVSGLWVFAFVWYYVISPSVRVSGSTSSLFVSLYVCSCVRVSGSASSSDASRHRQTQVDICTHDPHLRLSITWAGGVQTSKQAVPPSLCLSVSLSLPSFRPSSKW